MNIAKGRQQVLLQSSLQGVTSALPAPLAKSAGEALPLQVELAPDERLKVKLGRVLAAEFVRRRQGEALVVQRAGVSLSPSGDAPLRLPERSGTLIYGSLAMLDADKWRCHSSAAPTRRWTRARSTCGSASSTSSASG